MIVQLYMMMLFLFDCFKPAIVIDEDFSLYSEFCQCVFSVLNSKGIPTVLCIRSGTLNYSSYICIDNHTYVCLGVILEEEKTPVILFICSTWKPTFECTCTCMFMHTNYFVMCCSTFSTVCSS